MRSAIFLGRDGTLNELLLARDGGWEPPHSAVAAVLLPGVVESLAQLRAKGWFLAVVSNQPDLAHGRCTWMDLLDVHCKLVTDLAYAGLRLDAWQYCFHHPEATYPPLRRLCLCRKPLPGLLLRLANEFQLDLPSSWMVGDSETDMLAGRAAHCRVVRVSPLVGLPEALPRLLAEGPLHGLI